MALTIEFSSQSNLPRTSQPLPLVLMVQWKCDICLSLHTYVEDRKRDEFFCPNCQTTSFLSSYYFMTKHGIVKHFDDIKKEELQNVVEMQKKADNEKRKSLLSTDVELKTDDESKPIVSKKNDDFDFDPYEEQSLLEEKN